MTSAVPLRGARLAVLLVAAALAAGLLGACGNGATGTGQATTSAAPAYPEPADTPASRLRSEFTAALMDWTWLAAQASSTGGGGEAETGASPAGALENARISLATMVGKQYKEAEQPVLAALRSRDAALQKYRSGDKEGARRDLDGFRTTLASVFAERAPLLERDRFAESLKPHVDALLEVADAGEGGGDRLALLVQAADATAPAAQEIAEGITQSKQLAGSATSPAANLRADLTRILVNHTWLAAAMGRAGEGEGARPAETAVEANAVALADVWARHYAEAREPFLASWREYIALLKKYRPYAGTGPVQRPSVAVTPPPTDRGTVRVELDNHRRGFGQLLSRSIPGWPEVQAVDLLGAHRAALLQTFDFEATDDPRWYNSLPQASGHAMAAAGKLGGEMAKHRRLEG